MGFRDAGYREYNKMSENGLRKMTNSEMVEEAIDTIKIGRRKTIHGKSTLHSFFRDKCSDQSLGREGVLDLQVGLEMLIKGLIEYYGESYVENHYTDQNGDILEGLCRQYPELITIHDAFGILKDDDFSFGMYKCSKFPKYETFKTDKTFRNLAYKLADLLLKYVNTYILVDGKN